MNRQQRRAWGPVVLALRISRGLTQDELAIAADTTRQTIGSIENGRGVGQEAVLRRLLARLGLDPDKQAPSEVVQTIHAVLPQLPFEDRMPAIVAVVSLIMGGGEFPPELAESAFDAISKTEAEASAARIAEDDRGAV